MKTATMLLMLMLTLVMLMLMLMLVMLMLMMVAVMLMMMISFSSRCTFRNLRSQKLSNGQAGAAPQHRMLSPATTDD